MRTHVALLRGINVGGRNKVAMPALRTLVESLGHTEVATYVQSGNVVFRSKKRNVRALAHELEEAIAARLGVQSAVVVVDRGQLSQVIAANPYPHEADHRRLHAVFRPEEPTADDLAAIEAAARRARERGSDDELTVVGSTLYLHTPDGFGRSELAAQLSRVPGAAGTARNWATVLNLMALLDE